MTKTKVLVRKSGWVFRVMLVTMGVYIVLFFQPNVELPPIEFMFRWGIGPGFVFLALALPFTRVSISNNTMRVWQMSLWRQKVYRLSLTDPPPPMLVRTNPGTDGPDSYTVVMQMVDGREIDLTTWNSEAEAFSGRHEFLSHWTQNNPG